ncbi:MAG TPA: rhodanese-like domain-containing protein [Thermoanaerobaculia bacterium]|nr:rhodanese-like domain-containing protein [Thermoanaerobaculia bacterium]
MRRTALLALCLLLLPGCSALKRRMAERAAHRPPYSKVSPPIAYEMMHDSPNILILDLRSPQAFNGDTGHLFRAYNIPVDRLPYRLLELSALREETFLVYCDTQVCSEEGMAVLTSSGFENAVLMDGGIDGWIRKGFRTVLPLDLAGHAAETAAAQKSGRQLTPPAPVPVPVPVPENATPPPPPPPPR